MKSNSQSTMQKAKEILSRKVPNRMTLTDVLEWLFKKELYITANHFLGMVGTDAVMKIDDPRIGDWYYIDTEVVRRYLVRTDNEKLWWELESEVTTMVGLTSEPFKYNLA
jgi:hypothetical protein